MKTLFGTVGCIQISTLLLVVSASGAFAAARSAGDVCVEVYRSRPSDSDVQVDATERLNTRLSKTDTAMALDEFDTRATRVGRVSWHHTMWRRCRMGVST